MWLVFYKRVSKVQYVENSSFPTPCTISFAEKNVAKNLQIIRENTIGYVTQSFNEFFKKKLRHKRK